MIRWIQYAALTVLLCAGSLTVRAQDAFVVMSVKGKVEQATSKRGPWKPLSVGQTLGREHVVRTSFASYAKIMVNNARLVSIDQNQTKPLADFTRSRNGRDASASATIIAYAARQLTNAKSGAVRTVSGAVRGQDASPGAVLPKAAVMSEAPQFLWVDADTGSAYEFELIDNALRMVEKRTVHGTSFAPDASTLQLTGRSDYYWRVRRLSDGMESELRSFRVLAPDTVALIRRELEALDMELRAMQADDVTRCLVRAIYFERKRLYSDAFAEYRTVLALAPDVEEYRDMFRGLLAELHMLGEEDRLLR